ncbi:pyruvate dehydrogenase kinase [Cryptococcus deuterogattii 99/473]|uniref:Protein-serine/threonine kinase n=1 Tax=Cryptococcus deuterogattii Ram5 TaxID=1296110 RepID=A0A0D0TY83_9TREE|nr:pyruvate dehydrogenase kinase [Cryptococcus deuterogattii LA55]KIR33610.1 pyruvate dehydrogenase kinase [Cryptococcus deuterogattii MMRL2647]KIR40838.1 pyruvate dehydrogenase kinase [Cryptococcus deuterogattii Ram5]KIR74519.1 pyruvate dehydrogenase kinase [Cryptococcus deuterogattii CA1014]KIR93992.1 pyruvate dehydrogenase kinase [Cryptococcus deuterogattii CBS 10090]KIS00999.1 pyruvate dehydrogenase kinase [Cryptococcus deuterogattii 2001/935-1]KIY58474.1 pyruvate dehydrogenase kinase [Cr
MSRFKISGALWDKIHHYSSFPQTGVSLQQMIHFGHNPTPGTLLKASQFLSEELPIRLSHRVVELNALPDGLAKMPSINKVKEWYAQSFEELVTFPKPRFKPELEGIFNVPSSDRTKLAFPSSTPNPSLNPLMDDGPVSSGLLIERQNNGSGNGNGNENGKGGGNGNGNGNGNGQRLRIPMERRYYSPPPATIVYPPEVHEYNEKFTHLLENIKKRHDPTVTTVAQGVLEWKKKRKAGRIGVPIQEWLDRFYMSRIGIRFLIGQHIALNTLQPHPDYVGIICTRANVHDICHEAIENARYVCEEHYGLFKGPPIQLLCPKDLTFPYVPGHLSHICFELLKNSLRAVVERFGVDNEDAFPPIKVVVVEGSEDITIKISDEGGGIPRSAIPMIWTYLYTTMSDEGLEATIEQSDFKAPMAGFGYGLPLARLYARFFGGDLRLISMDGYGTDVYISLNKLSSR